HLRQIRFELEGALRGKLGLLPVIRDFFGEVDLRRIVGIGFERPGERELVVEIESTLNLLEALRNEILIRTAAVDAVQQRACGQVQIVGTRIGRSPQHSALLQTKSYSQGCSDGSGDVFLDGEDVIELAIVRVGPERKAVFRVDQSRIDSDLVAGLADAAL